MTMFRRLKALANEGTPIRVGITGAGFVARGLIHQLELTPGMEPSLVVSRDPGSAVDAFVLAGYDRAGIVVSDDPEVLGAAIDDGKRAVTANPGFLEKTNGLDVLVEATGDVEYGAMVTLLALDGGKHVVSLNYEMDATLGPALSRYARGRDLVYTGSDGDQPGVMMRLIEYVRGIGLEVVVAVNCKGFLDLHATPESIRPWAERQRTSLKMTTAFTDGTKMQVENCCVANAAGLHPARRGMIGVETSLADAVADFSKVISGTGLVDYTLGGDFGSGVFVIATGAHPELAAPYLEYLKMGSGPWYLFFRPWHLVQFETPLSIAEAMLDHLPTIAPAGAPTTQVIAHAKRDLSAAATLDEIGGWDHYGLVDNSVTSLGELPVGLAEGAVLVSDVSQDRPIRLDEVELDEKAPIVRLWRAQKTSFSSVDGSGGAFTSTWMDIRSAHGF
jgi:predicted homoserine dehydrogenase-like protein